ncbi:MAG: type II toxin-antitoxin system HicB family antitoxin [Deltaproteobacteria bacterium]|nr:type II toxin-antitoxin system HicB family antitoxin [Deltaproteobacteria bacterium]
MNRFLVIIEKASDGYSVYAPDLPGCIATGATQEEAERNMHAAIALHIEGLRAENQPIPESSSLAEFIEI